MKKRVLLAGMMLLLINAASEAQSFHYGLKASMSMSKIDGTGLKSSFTPGFQGGAFAEYDFTKKIGIQPELLFTQVNGKKGDDFYTYYVNSGNTYANDAIKLSFATLPVLVRYNINDVITFHLGPQFSYLFFADENLVKKDKDAFSKTEVSAVAGVQINVSNVRFFGRYSLGLSDMNDIDDRYKWHTEQIHIGLGVAFK